MFNIRYSPGAFRPEFLPLRAMAYVHCEVGAMQVIDSRQFAEHHIDRPGASFLISWANSGISDLMPGNSLWNKLEILRNRGHKIEVFPAALYTEWQEWDPTARITIDGLRITKLS